MTILVFLVDDHAMVREGLASVIALEPDIEIIGEAADGDEALRLLMSEPRLAVTVIDVNLPRLNGIELTRRIAELQLPKPVLLLTKHSGLEFVRAGLAAGALGYVTKNSRRAELVAAIRAVAAGHRFIGSDIDQGGLTPALRGEPRGHEALTPRERDVLRLVAQGLGSKAIADTLDLTPRTVEWYRAGIMAKLKIDHVAGLVKYALRHHLASLDD